MNNKLHINRLREIIGGIRDEITEELTTSRRLMPDFSESQSAKYMNNCFMDIESLTVGIILMELHDKNFTKENNEDI